MTTAKDVALYFLKKDENKDVFDFELMQIDGVSFYKGNARLNKYLHLSQNLYLAMYGEPLFIESLFAYDNGAVVPSVQKNYRRLRTEFSGIEIDLSYEQKNFLDKVYNMLENATINELIELSHEDREWEMKNKTSSQIMDSLANIVEYSKQYSDAVELLEIMV